MNKALPIISLVIFLLTCAAPAFADFEPGVWDQMQDGAVNTVDGKVKRFEIRGASVVIKIEKDDGETFSETLHVCYDRRNELRSEEEGAAYFNQRVSTLRAAFKSKETVHVAYKGPWNPCLVSVALGD